MDEAHHPGDDHDHLDNRGDHPTPSGAPPDPDRGDDTHGCQDERQGGGLPGHETVTHECSRRPHRENDKQTPGSLASEQNHERDAGSAQTWAHFRCVLPAVFRSSGVSEPGTERAVIHASLGSVG